MCKWGTTKTIELNIPANLSSTGRKKLKKVEIDSCIVFLVKALNSAGILTVASCCGHGKHPGNIALADGREIIIIPNFETARKTEDDECSKTASLPFELMRKDAMYIINAKSYEKRLQRDLRADDLACHVLALLDFILN